MMVDIRMMTNPYEADPTRIPCDDPYLARSSSYGRYSPHVDDFTPQYDYWHGSEAQEIPYWKEVVDKYCIQKNSLREFGNRDAFAVGKIIIRIDQENYQGTVTEQYSHLNANELCAARKAEDILRAIDVTVPMIFFCGSINGKNVTVESRIPGVSLEVAWRYLTEQQRDSFRQQCRDILQRLGSAGSSPDGPSYVCPSLNAQLSSYVQGLEQEILFSTNGESEELCLVHNDMVRSNIIVNNDRVVGILGWRQSGFFGHDRARRVHREIRIPNHDNSMTLEEEFGEESTWADLYDSQLGDAQQRIVADVSQDDISSIVKIEPSVTSLDKVPMNSSLSHVSCLDGADITDEHPTPKKINDLKRDSISRASSSERSSPTAPSKSGPLGRKAPTAPSKKGTAVKKQAPKKRKLRPQDTESLDGRRSNTPASTRANKTSSGKKQGSMSVASSPAPENKKSAKDVPADDVDDEMENGNEVFCVCRKPDNHTWMIACDGGCEDWFHGKCVNIDPKDADLIDKYICQNCRQQGKGNTTWKPMCRLKDCRRPARVSRKIPSKYCSDEHGRDFMRYVLQNLNYNNFPGQSGYASRGQVTKNPKDTNSTEGDADSNVDDGAASNEEDEAEDCVRDSGTRSNPDLGSRGGVLTIGDLKAAVMGVSSANEFCKLGNRIVSPPPEEHGNGDMPVNQRKLGLDVDAKDVIYSPDEEAKLQKLRKQRDELLRRQEILRIRNQFMALVRQRAKSILERLKQTDPKGGWKDICGFDSRLSWSDDEFDEWRLSDAGALALKNSTLSASDPAPTDADGDRVMAETKNEEANIDTFTRGTCLKKRCERHKQWAKVHQQDMQFEESVVQQDLLTCEREAQAAVERAVLRTWAEEDGAWVR